MALTAPAIEEQPLAAALSVVVLQPPAAGPIPTAVTTAGTQSGQKPYQNPLSPLKRDYDPTRDDLTIDELLARPRLPPSPYESHQKGAKNGRTMKPLKAFVAGACGASGENSRRAEEFEMEKQRLHALGIEMGKLKFPSEKE